MVNWIQAITFSALGLALLMILAGTYNLLRMGAYIRPGTQTVAGFYVAWPRNRDFTDPRGKTYRNRYILCFALGLLFMAVFCVLLSQTPNYDLSMGHPRQP